MKDGLQKNGRISSNFFGYYRILIASSTMAMILHAFYAYIILPLHLSSTNTQRFFIRLAFHPFLFEVILTTLRWMIEKATFLDRTSSIVLFVPIQFIQSLWGRVLVITLNGTEGLLSDELANSSNIVVWIGIGVVALEELLLRLSFSGRESLRYCGAFRRNKVSEMSSTQENSPVKNEIDKETLFFGLYLNTEMVTEYTGTEKIV